MYEEDISLLRCPVTGALVRLTKVSDRSNDGEIIAGILSAGDNCYEITNGIPRFIKNISYNASWDFKWRVLDGGRGLNYRILDKTDPAYLIHDIFDRNSHGGIAFRHMTGGTVLDLGCGVGQYAIKSLEEHRPEKLVAVDLTSGVDILGRSCTNGILTLSDVF